MIKRLRFFRMRVERLGVNGQEAVGSGPRTEVNNGQLNFSSTIEPVLFFDWLGVVAYHVNLVGRHRVVNATICGRFVFCFIGQLIW